jgi:hypothetical protein
MPFIYTAEEWLLEHGRNAYDPKANVTWCADGACWRYSDNTGHPPDPARKIEYIRTRCANVIREYEIAISYCKQQAEIARMGAGPLPTPESVENVARLKSLMHECQDELLVATSTAEKVDVVRNAVRERKAAHKAKAQEILMWLKGNG